MRQEKPINAALLEIVRFEVRAFTGRSLLRKLEGGKQAALVDDLVSVGNEALLRAVEHFDPARGTLKTYAAKVVKNAIRSAARPRKKDALSRELVRLDAPLTLDDELTSQHESIPDEAGALLDKIPESVWRCLQQAMPEREFDVLLSCHAGFIRAEIGARLGISAERVRQIRLRAVETVRRLYQTDATLRLAMNASRFLAEQMADAMAVLSARHSSQSGFWSYRDGLRFLEAEAGAYREPTDWTDALVIAAKLAMLELGMKLPTRQLKRRTENVRQTTSHQRWRRNPPRFEAAAGRRGASTNDQPRDNHPKRTRRASQV